MSKYQFELGNKVYSSVHKKYGVIKGRMRKDNVNIYEVKLDDSCNSSLRFLENTFLIEQSLSPSEEVYNRKLKEE